MTSHTKKKILPAKKAQASKQKKTQLSTTDTQPSRHTIIRAIVLIGCLAGTLALSIMFILEHYIFQIIDLCNSIGINRKLILLPAYAIPLLVPDLTAMLFGFAGITISEMARGWMIFIFNFALYGGLAAWFVHAKSKKKFLKNFGICAVIVIILVLVLMW